MTEPATPEIDVVKLMQSIRTEAKHDFNETDVSADGSPRTGQRVFFPSDSTFTRPDSRKPDAISRMRLMLPELEVDSGREVFIPHDNGQYRLHELVQRDGPAFIRVAYQAVFGRDVDDDGFANYLKLLRGGATKTQILGWLSSSPEGKSRGVRIKGLRLQLAIENLSRWPLIGALIRYVASLCHLPALELKYRHLSTELACELEDLRNEARTNLRSAYEALRTVERFHNLQSDMNRSYANRAKSASQELQAKFAGLAAFVERSTHGTNNDVAPLPASSLTSSCTPAPDDAPIVRNDDTDSP